MADHIPTHEIHKEIVDFALPPEKEEIYRPLRLNRQTHFGVASMAGVIGANLLQRL
jgi:hypothetical protein